MIDRVGVSRLVEGAVGQSEGQVVAADVFAAAEPAEPLRSDRIVVAEVGIVLGDVHDRDAARRVVAAGQCLELGVESEKDGGVCAEAVVLGLDRAKVAIDRIESEQLGARRRMSREIGVSVLGADVVGEGESVKIFVARGARNAKVRNRRTAVGLASFAGPSRETRRWVFPES